jgi:type I restriction enzyme R subunit
MKVAVKRLLKKYGYPPDLEQLAIDMVLKQAEVMSLSASQEFRY